MKFKLKALLASVAFAAAGHAAAAIPAGDAVFYAWDAADSASIVIDLGAASTLNAANSSTQTFNIAADSNWATFAGLANFSTSTLWGIVDAPDASHFTSTVIGTAAAPVTAGFATINGNFGSLLSNTSSSFSTSGISYWGNSLQDQLSVVVSFHTGSALNATGVKLDTFSFTGSGRNAVMTVSPFVQTAAFDGSNLTLSVAAVPEPGTYAMMVAGLLMIGAISRRRMS